MLGIYSLGGLYSSTEPIIPLLTYVEDPIVSHQDICDD